MSNSCNVNTLVTPVIPEPDPSWLDRATSTIETIVDGTATATKAAIKRVNRLFHWTQHGNAQRLMSRHHEEIRYCHDWGKWLVWNGKRWEQDDSGAEIRGLALDTVKSIFDSERPSQPQEPFEDEEDKAGRMARWKQQTSDLAKFVLRCENVNQISGMITFAQDMMMVRATDLDADPFLFNCQNGTIDLRTGTLLPHDRAHLQTKISPAAYDPRAACPTWLKFLHEIFDGNTDVITYMQKALGHSLSGDAGLKLFFVLYGGSDNGKTTLLKTFNRHIMGDYGGLIDVNALMLGAGDNKRDTSIADLVGKRFVMSSEVNEGNILNAALVKKLTGDDDQIARRLFREHFSFRPQFKLFLDTNERPGLSAADQAAWNRMRSVPFPIRFYDPDSPEAAAGLPVKDFTLANKLEAEADGILAWAVQGCLAWQHDTHLKTPAAVRESNEEYRQEQDVVEQFINEWYEKGEDLTVETGKIYADYEGVCLSRHVKPISKIMFGKRLEQLGYKDHRTGSSRMRVGLAPKKR